MSIKNQFSPDYVIHPGEILEETLQARGISNMELAARCEVTPKHISSIINGKAPITPETAIMLERILDVKASLWLKIDADYKLFAQREKEKKELDTAITWARKFPIKELVLRGFLPATISDNNLVAALLDFFNVGSVGAWEKQYADMAVQFRKSTGKADTSNNENIAAWLKIGENKAKEIPTAIFSKQKFKSALQKIRTLTVKIPTEFAPELVKICAENGVAVVFVKEFPGTKICGATYWLGGEKAILMLSLRYSWADIFWFTFFHEAGHLFLHSKDLIIVDGREFSGSTREDEANDFAANILIPPEQYKSFLLKYGRPDKSAITSFAKTLNIAPGIIVGRLQKEGRIPYSRFNDLREQYRIKD
jgi:HTH-type transcriptional regulator/antitoxin HigA